MADKKIKALTAAELSAFCTQVAMMLDSGIMLYSGMEALAKTYEGSPSGETYKKVTGQYVQTGSLHEALKNCGGWPDYLVAMVGIGERTGKLETILQDLAAYYQRESRMGSAIRSAVTYPLVLGVMMVLIILIMIVKVLPVFRNVLANLGLSMDGSANMLMRAGLTIGWVVLALVGLMILAIIICVLLMRTGLRAKVVAMLSSLFPPMKHIAMRMSSARVASVLSMMLSGGFPLSEALEMVPAVLEDPVVRERIRGVKGKVEEGVPMGDALPETGLFDEMSNCIIRTGCEVGRADLAMEKVARDYEHRAEESLEGLVSIIEPTLVGVLAMVIGAILLAVMLPMAGIISSIL